LLLGDVSNEPIQDVVERRNNYGERVDGPWIFGIVEEKTKFLNFFCV
jgi:hypothetical protein